MLGSPYAVFWFGYAARLEGTQPNKALSVAFKPLSVPLQSKDAQLLKLEADMAKMQQQQLEGRACIKATGTQSCNRGTKFEEDHFSASAWLQLLTPR